MLGDQNAGRVVDLIKRMRMQFHAVLLHFTFRETQSKAIKAQSKTRGMRAYR